MIGAYVLAKTRWGYETFATGGNEQAAIYAGIPTRWVRTRAYLMSALCATLAGLMASAQDKGVTPLYGISAELIVIASVIIGGASILGGRGRVAGSCLGAALTVLIDKVLREGYPTTRIVRIGDEEVQVSAIAQLPVGAVPVFLGLLLLIAVLIEPYLIRRQVPARLWAWLRSRPPPPAFEIGGVAMESGGTRGAARDATVHAGWLGRFLARRDALAIVLAVFLWLVGLYLRPDYWWNLPNTFAILLNYTELALISVGLTYVIAAGDIDLSVGAVLALAGSTAAYYLKVLGADPSTAIVMGLLAGMAAGLVNAVVTVGFRLPAFIATLGMFYIARGLAAWFVAGQQLTGWPETFNLLGRKVGDILAYFGIQLGPGIVRAVADVVSVQTIWMVLVALIAGIILAYAPFGQRVYATGGNIRAAAYSGINTNRVRFISLMLAAGLRDHGGHHQRRLLPQLQPGGRAVARARRHSLGDHRRRVDLRRLRHDDRLARRRRRDHPGQGAAPAQHHNLRRPVIRHAPALGERLHRPHSHRCGSDRHLDSPVQYSCRNPDALAYGGTSNPVGAMSETVRSAPIVEMRKIHKAFGAVNALIDVELVLYPGEILGLVGDNSAGKSTLMKILTGAYQRDAGEVIVAGEPVHFRSPHESRKVGIEMIYQDFALCGNLDVGQNIFLGRWPCRRFFVDRRRMYAEADQVLKRLKVDVNSVYQRVESLSGGRQQSVAIARAISFDPRVVVLDEPTANLSAMATERLLETMLELKKHGVAQIIISHRLQDIFAVGDRVMVLKRGENVGDRYVGRTSEHEILELIVSGKRQTATRADQAIARIA